MRDSSVVRGAISGIVWAGIAVFLLADGHINALSSAAWWLRGGILAAPLIGVAVGITSPVFREAALIGRILIALSTLYLAAFAFLLAARVGALLPAGATGPTLSVALFDSWNAAIAGLTWTGFVFLLFPLALVNHFWVSRPRAA